MSDPVNLYEYEELAKQRMPKLEYDFIAGGATDEITMRRTREVLDSIMLRPRPMVDVSKRDTSTTVLGHPMKFPVMTAPSGSHARAHPDAEFATVRAAAAAGILAVISSRSTHRMEDIAKTAKAAKGSIWFQYDFFKDRDLTLDLAERAQAAGYTALCMTLDSRVGSKRERNIRNGYVIAPTVNYSAVEAEKGATQRAQLKSLSATWTDLDWLVSKVSVPVLVKGIMTGEDAVLAVEHGAKALIVSNHGGRQLDTTWATIEVLPECVDAVNGRAEVYVDGGIRRGTDILKALALGARAVLIGRPIYWGLAVNGEAGFRRVLEMLREEMDTAMGMCGRPNIASIDRTLVEVESPLVRALANGKSRPLQLAR